MADEEKKQAAAGKPASEKASTKGEETPATTDEASAKASGEESPKAGEKEKAAEKTGEKAKTARAPKTSAKAAGEGASKEKAPRQKSTAPKSAAKKRATEAKREGKTIAKADDEATAKREGKTTSGSTAVVAAAEKAQPFSVSSVPSKRRNLPLAAWIAIAAGCLVVGVLLGHFVLGGLLSGNNVAGKTSLTSDELDDTVATYTYDGKTYDISARDAITSTTSLDADQDSDGNYTMPSADNILSVARNAILAKAVAAAGITVSDDDVTAYAESTLGTSDYDTIASEYSMDSDSVQSVLRQSAGVKELYDEVVTTTTTTAPTAPTSAASGEESVATADYGAYVVNLLGDEWDSTNETWARTDGPYYSAMSSETFTSTSATYTQAEEAYYVAYQQYASSYSSASSQWTSYVNGLLSNASINVFSIVS